VSKSDPSKPASTASKQAPAFGFILASVALDALSLGLVWPILPKLIVSLTGDTGGGATAFGLMTAVWSLMNFLASPVLGALSDRFGRRPVILISTFGLALDFLVMAWAPTVAWLFVGRALSGLTAASRSAASAYLADVTPAEQRARRFGLFAAASGAGFILGPAMGGLLAGIGPRVPFLAAAGLAGVGWLYGLLVLPESLPPALRIKRAWTSANPVRALGILGRDRRIFGLAAISTLVQFAGQAVNIVFVLYAGYRYHWGVAEVGLTLTVFAGGNILVMGVIGPRLAHRIGERPTLLWGVGLSAIGMVWLGLAPTALQFCLACVITCLGNMCAPPLQSLQTQQVGPTEQGRLQGALGALIGLNGLAGPIFFTQVFAWSIAPGSAVALSGAPLLIAALLMAAALPWAMAVAGAPRPAAQAQPTG
jgi:DHA1 family tetracycline resistance protein-like MFS transporter